MGILKRDGRRNPEKTKRHMKASDEIFAKFASVSVSNVMSIIDPPAIEKRGLVTNAELNGDV